MNLIFQIPNMIIRCTRTGLQLRVSYFRARACLFLPPSLPPSLIFVFLSSLPPCLSSSSPSTSTHLFIHFLLHPNAAHTLRSRCHTSFALFCTLVVGMLSVPLASLFLSSGGHAFPRPEPQADKTAGGVPSVMCDPVSLSWPTKSCVLSRRAGVPSRRAVFSAGALLRSTLFQSSCQASGGLHLKGKAGLPCCLRRNPIDVEPWRGCGAGGGGELSSRGEWEERFPEPVLPINL